jgi:hypothetical protein
MTVKEERAKVIFELLKAIVVLEHRGILKLTHRDNTHLEIEIIIPEEEGGD